MKLCCLWKNGCYWRSSCQSNQTRLRTMDVVCFLLCVQFRKRCSRVKQGFLRMLVEVVWSILQSVIDARHDQSMSCTRVNIAPGNLLLHAINMHQLIKENFSLWSVLSPYYLLCSVTFSSVAFWTSVSSYEILN